LIKAIPDYDNINPTHDGRYSLSIPANFPEGSTPAPPAGQ